MEATLVTTSDGKVREYYELFFKNGLVKKVRYDSQKTDNIHKHPFEEKLIDALNGSKEIISARTIWDNKFYFKSSDLQSFVRIRHPENDPDVKYVRENLKNIGE